jgi:creatinine amidohydrolase/Fe(II)-dependent formamide hydrolase-like protein
MIWSERSWVELPHDLERVGRAAILPVRTSNNGVTGAPSRASADKGRLWFSWMVEDYARRSSGAS